MPIPESRTIMPEFLNQLTDMEEHSDLEITRAIANVFELSREERTRFLPNSDRKMFVDRMARAKAELSKAGLIKIPRRGVAQITDRGLAVLQQRPVSLDRDFLEQFPEYRERIGSAGDSPEALESLWHSVLSPREVLEGGYQRLRRELAAEILARLRAGSADLFQRLVIDLLVAMGYSRSLRDAVRSLGRTGDSGIEGTTRVDRLGTDTVHVRARRGEEPVGRREVEGFERAMQAKLAWRGVFIATSGFGEDARSYLTAMERSVALVNGEDLAELMIDYDVGVSTTEVYPVKSVDNDSFRED